jgi:hypothetical protein
MDTVVRTVAVVRGNSSAEVQNVFLGLVERWQGLDRIAGLLAENHGLANRACSAGFLRNIANGKLFSIFQDLGPGPTACHDELGVLSAAAAVQQDVAAGCDLVLLSKFGKLEADRKGLFSAFRVALPRRKLPLIFCWGIKWSCELPPQLGSIQVLIES